MYYIYILLLLLVVVFLLLLLVLVLLLLLLLLYIYVRIYYRDSARDVTSWLLCLLNKSSSAKSPSCCGSMPSPRRSLFNSCAEIISLLWTASSCNAKFPMNANGIMWHGNAQPCGFGMLYNSCEILVLCRVPMWNCHTSSAMVFDDPIPNWHRIGTKLASRSHQINLTSKG